MNTIELTDKFTSGISNAKRLIHICPSDDYKSLVYYRIMKARFHKALERVGRWEDDSVSFTEHEIPSPRTLAESMIMDDDIPQHNPIAETIKAEEHYRKMLSNEAAWKEEARKEWIKLKDQNRKKEQMVERLKLGQKALDIADKLWDGKDPKEHHRIYVRELDKLKEQQKQEENNND